MKICGSQRAVETVALGLDDLLDLPVDGARVTEEESDFHAVVLSELSVVSVLASIP